MGFRFRKTFKLGPFRFTSSKSGISGSFGVKGFRVTRRADGKTQTTVSIPGTGISHVSTHGSVEKKEPAIIRVQEIISRYEFVTFYLDNSCEKNPDGQKRQDILYCFKMRRPPFEHAAELSLLSDSDAPEQIQVAINGMVVGDVPPAIAAQLNEQWDRIDAVTAMDVEGRRGEYRAYTYVRLLREEALGVAHRDENPGRP